MESKFKLDYQYKCGNLIVFAYKGTEGSWNEETKLLKYGNKEYQCSARKISDSEPFTIEDMDFLIALNNGIFIVDLPFKLESGNRTLISLNSDWLAFQGLAILANSEDSKYFRVEGDKLFVDDKEVDYHEQCIIHDHSYGHVTYGIPYLWGDTARVIVWHQLQAGCKVSYLKTLLQYLPLKYSEEWFAFSQKGYENDTRDYIFYDTKLSKTPINKVVKCIDHIGEFRVRIDYTIEKPNKLHGFKPLQHWKEGSTGDTTANATGFFFYNNPGFLYQYADGRFSVTYGDYTHNSTDKYIKENLNHDLYIAIQEYIKGKR